ncbi:GNAT family N-acetyltransferase [Phormidesmis priestleyi]
MEEYLKVSEVIDWHHPRVVERAQQIAARHETSIAIAKACFEWVRDEICHSFDYQMNPVTCRASDVLKYETGYCYAKSHLLAALLRANQIPAGFCYQRLSLDDKGLTYSLHGFNAIYLCGMGWYRVDARGNKEGVNAQFSPPQERLAFKTQFPEEADFQSILAEPLQIVVEALQTQSTWDGMLHNLPDLSVESAKRYGLNDIIVFESAYQIRIACVEELPLLSHIERSAAGLFLDTPYSFLVNADPLPLDFVQQQFQAGQVWVAVAQDESVVGYAITREVDETLYLHQIDVEPEHGRRGIGTALVKTVCTWAKQQGYSIVSLSTFRDIPWNAPFYSKLGFTPVDEAELTTGFQQLRLQELEAGLPISERVVMYCEFQPPNNTDKLKEIWG